MLMKEDIGDIYHQTLFFKKTIESLLKKTVITMENRTIAFQYIENK